MELLPTASGTRPRLACEIRPEGIIAARSASALAEVDAIGRSPLPAGAVEPGLKAGNLADVGALSQALRQALDTVAGRGAERGRYVTIVVPDAAVRVLLIDFDALPAKASEALPVVRFRLKKLLPFDVEHALVSYQQIPAEGGGVRVLAVAIPREVLAEYEDLVTRAGFLPGAVLPSTLAALAGLDGAAPALVVNADASTVTTAIVRDGALLLHRTIEVGGDGDARPWSIEANDGVTDEAGELRLPLVDRATSAEEWAMQEPVGYDELEAVAAMGDEDVPRRDPVTLAEAPERAVSMLNQSPAVTRSREIAQAISVAAAYFEDTLRMPIDEVLAAGTMGATRLAEVLEENGLSDLRVRELVSEGAAGAVASQAGTARGWLAGVRGALRG